MEGISAEEQAKVDLYRSLLYTTQTETDLATNEVRQVTRPTPMRQAYLAGQQAYAAATQRYSALRQGANTSSDTRAVLDFAQNAPLYRRQVQAAMADWIASGYKNEVEMMEAYIAEVTGRATAS